MACFFLSKPHPTKSIKMDSTPESLYQETFSKQLKISSYEFYRINQLLCSNNYVRLH